MFRPLFHFAKAQSHWKTGLFGLSGTRATVATILLRKCQIRAYSIAYIRYTGVFKCFWKNGVAVVAVVHFNAVGAGWHGMAHSDVLY